MSENSQSQLRDANKKSKHPKKRRKINLVFDEDKRREFLGGFRKRKLERKVKAKEKLEQQLKAERKKIKQQARERYKKLLSNRAIPEIEELLSRHEYDLKDHTVSILDLNIADLAEGSKWIGQNKFAEEEEDDKNEHSNDDNDDDDEIIGMSLTEKQEVPVQQKSKSDSQEIKSSKELKREIRKATLKQIRKSKVFQQKQRLEQQKNKKQSRQNLHRDKKLAHKHGKRKRKMRTT